MTCREKRFLQTKDSANGLQDVICQLQTIQNVLM